MTGPHLFQFDGTRDVFGRSYCATCGLPKANRAHTLPDPVPDTASRAAGEPDEDDEGDE